ncbi:MAG: hypothetical protein V4760_15100 [Bdellovibrionota bacterium]
MTSDADVEDVWIEVLPVALKGASAKRKNEWIQGRIAVQRAFAKAGVNVGPQAFHEGDPQIIASLPGWSFSLSHTSEWAFAWVTNEHVSIGVDIEDVSRAISSGVEKKFRRDDDRSDLDAIHLWSLKEAAFKSVPRDRQKDLVVSSLVIGSDTFSCVDRDVRGHWRQETTGDLVRSFAWLDAMALSRK